MERGTNGVWWTRHFHRFSTLFAVKDPRLIKLFCGKELFEIGGGGPRFPPPRKKEIRSKNSFFLFNFKYWNIKIKFSQILLKCYLFLEFTIRNSTHVYLNPDSRHFTFEYIT